ncbi:MAG TPA: hypothetical protein VHO72_08875 [Bacteroidales bacterium]|nr:hypothetical protein [Bacteroidales bacterium]
MELNEMQNIWKQYDKKISEYTRLNKEILKRMLIQKPEKRLNWIKIKAGLKVFYPVILLSLCFLDVKFDLTVKFYLGLTIIIPIIIVGYIWDLKYFFLVRKIDFSQTVLSIRKNVAELEKYKIKITRIRYIVAPIAMVGAFFIFIPSHGPVYNVESIVMLILIVFVFLSSMYFTFKYSIYEQFRKLNNEIAEIAELERE